MVQPQAQKQPSWWQRIFTTAPRGQYAVDEKQQNVKEKEFIIMRWNLAIYRNKYLNMFLNEHLTTVKVMPVDMTLMTLTVVKCSFKNMFKYLFL